MEAKTIVEALIQCEERLRKLAAQAAAEGDYDVLGRLSSTAHTVSEMARSWSGEEFTQESVRAKQVPSPPLARLSAQQKYPCFFRNGNELIKIGWSKKQRREYQHRARRDVLVSILEALTN